MAWGLTWIQSIKPNAGKVPGEKGGGVRISKTLNNRWEGGVVFSKCLKKMEKGGGSWMTYHNLSKSSKYHILWITLVWIKNKSNHSILSRVGNLSEFRWTRNQFRPNNQTRYYYYFIIKQKNAENLYICN